VKLPDLEANTVELKGFRGEETLVLFWNPGCGFCQQMLPDLKERESDPPEGAPKLLFVSAGMEEANREMGLSSTMVLDQQFAVGRTFGASSYILSAAGGCRGQDGLSGRCRSASDLGVGRVRQNCSLETTARVDFPRTPLPRSSVRILDISFFREKDPCTYFCE
jgi:hypothetical protein